MYVRTIFFLVLAASFLFFSMISLGLKVHRGHRYSGILAIVNYIASEIEIIDRAAAVHYLCRVRKTNGWAWVLCLYLFLVFELRGTRKQAYLFSNRL